MQSYVGFLPIPRNFPDSSQTCMDKHLTFGQIGEIASKSVQKHMSQNVLTLLCHVTIKHPGTVLFCLTDSADGAAGQTGKNRPLYVQFPVVDVLLCKQRIEQFVEFGILADDG